MKVTSSDPDSNINCSTFAQPKSQPQPQPNPIATLSPQSKCQQQQAAWPVKSAAPLPKPPGRPPDPATRRLVSYRRAQGGTPSSTYVSVLKGCPASSLRGVSLTVPPDPLSHHVRRVRSCGMALWYPPLPSPCPSSTLGPVLTVSF